MKNLNLSTPWAILYHEIDAMFKKDPGVRVSFNSNIPEIRLYVEDTEKADALLKLLPNKKQFGNVTVNIVVCPANAVEESKIALLEKAFKGNEAFSRIQVVKEDFMTNPISYVLFKKEVVQYFTDDIGDAHGICSTLYQNIADELFGQSEGIHYCTEVE